MDHELEDLYAVMSVLWIVDTILDQEIGVDAGRWGWIVQASDIISGFEMIDGLLLLYGICDLDCKLCSGAMDVRLAGVLHGLCLDSCMDVMPCCVFILGPWTVWAISPSALLVGEPLQGGCVRSLGTCWVFWPGLTDGLG